jgi:hypothetical protein
MTYCIGCKYQNSVYLWADTAITKSEPLNNTLSSFGEYQRKVKDQFVEEGLLKIVPICDNVAVAFSGNVQLASNIIKYLQEQLEEQGNTQNLITVLNSINASLGPFSSNRAVELLVALSDFSGGSQLLYWNSFKGLDTNNSDYYEIGSMDSYHSQITPYFLSMLTNKNLDSDHVLPIISAIVQTYGIHDNMIDQNIGGIIFGLRVCNGEVMWQEDTNYLIYDKNFRTPIWVSAFVRDNVLIVNSSKTNETKILAHSISMVESQAWLEKWCNYISTELNKDHYRYWIFISMFSKVITVLKRAAFEKESRFIRINQVNDSTFDIAINQELMDILMQPLIDKKDGSLPFRLNFRND